MSTKIALVLSGGGARGIAHIGVIEALEENGYEITSIAGTSMGALVGGVYAMGNLRPFRDWLCHLDMMKILGLIDFALITPGLLKGDRLFQQLQEFMPDTSIEDLPIPYAAVAADLIRREEVVFRSGSLFQAVRASVSIPTLFTPVKTAQGLLVDGGVLNNIPVNHIQRIPGDRLVVVDVNADIPLHRAPKEDTEQGKEERQALYRQKLEEFYDYLQRYLPAGQGERMGYFDLISETISLMTNQLSKLMLQTYRPDLLIQIPREACSLYDFLKAEEMVAIGREIAQQGLSDFKKT